MLAPYNDAGQAVYVHAKLLIADDLFFRVVSSNIDRRSMGFDTEADVALLAQTSEDRGRIRGIRAGLVAEHLAADVDAVAGAIDEGGVIAGSNVSTPTAPAG